MLVRNKSGGQGLENAPRSASECRQGSSEVQASPVVGHAQTSPQNEQHTSRLGTGLPKPR